MNYSNRLYNFWAEYHNLIQEEFALYWENQLLSNDFNENKFLDLFNTPRESFIEFCKKNFQ